MKTITMPYDDYCTMEGSLKAMRASQEQYRKLSEEFLLDHTPEQLQAIRSNVKHPLWEAANAQLQARACNAELSKGKTRD